MAVYRLKGTSGVVANRSFVLSESLLIGRADDCDIRVDEDGVAAHHARVILTDDGAVTLRDLSSGNGTVLNGEAVTEAGLSSGDELRIGTCRLMLQAPGLRPERLLEDPVPGKSGARWSWLLFLALAAGAALAWYYGYFDGITSLVRD